VLLAWHAYEGAKLFVREFRSGNSREALGLLLALSRCNPLWPLRLVHGVMLRLVVGRLDAGAPRETIG